MMNQVVHSFTKECMKPQGYGSGGYGGGMPGDIRWVYIGYVKKEEVTIAQARRLYVTTMEELLPRINAVKALRPYLHEYPFKRRHIALTFSWRTPENDFFSEDKPTLLILSAQDNLVYASASSDQKLYELFSEPYEEALAIVRKEREHVECSS